MCIDFDLSSKAWLLNKKKEKNSTYKYVCMAKTKKNLPCKNNPIVHTNYCRIHNKNNYIY